MTAAPLPRPDAQVLLAAYDAQLRAAVPTTLAVGVSVEVDGPVVRFVGMGHRGFVDYRDVSRLSGAELDALIGRCRDAFASRGEGVEWKLRQHDRPDDLAGRLTAAGFVPEHRETVVIGLAEELAVALPSPPGVTLRETNDPADYARMAALHHAVWGEEWDWFPVAFAAEVAAEPGVHVVVLAEAGETLVAAARMRLEPGTEFATLWGGSTLAQWRGRGIYRSLVAHRAQVAARAGRRYLQVDASDDSRPILERLGFVAVTTTTPYVWTPS